MRTPTMAPPLTAADDVDAALAQRGFAVIDATQLQTLLGVMPGVAERALSHWAAFWNRLAPDPYLRDGGRYRQRRHGLTCKTAVHICYGYGIDANRRWKDTLGNQWRQYEQVFPALAKSRIDQVSLECMHSHVPLDLIGLLEGKEVMVGVIDVASDAVETADEVAETIGRALQFVARDKLIACTNCGMTPMARGAALAA